MFYLGLDFGTSGARAIAINTSRKIMIEAKCSYDLTDISTWQPALWQLFVAIPTSIRQNIRAIAIAGTSSTVFGSDHQGKPITDVLAYNDGRAVEVLDLVQSFAPPGYLVNSATSSLAKLLWFQKNWDDRTGDGSDRYLVHQADYLGFLLHGKLGMSDYHNALKLGYDPVKLEYPDWLLDLNLAINLPQILAPGTAIASILASVSDRFGFPPDCQICAGTTDSTAAFLASVDQPEIGTAVTCLGSSLVLKILSNIPLESPQHGVYSHRLDWQGQIFWLVGGASNTGGAVLRHFFTDAEIQTLSQQIKQNCPTKLDYYPLLKQGDRFPINDPHLSPRLEPRPNDPVIFLQGLLEGIAKIEAQGYELLQNLGAPAIAKLYSTGGGAANPTWTAMRQQLLGVELVTAINAEAAYGAALLAAKDHAYPPQTQKI